MLRQKTDILKEYWLNLCFKCIFKKKKKALVNALLQCYTQIRGRDNTQKRD